MNWLAVISVPVALAAVWYVLRFTGIYSMYVGRTLADRFTGYTPSPLRG